MSDTQDTPVESSLGASDEDFLKMTPPPAVVETAAEVAAAEAPEVTIPETDEADPDAVAPAAETQEDDLQEGAEGTVTDPATKEAPADGAGADDAAKPETEAKEGDTPAAEAIDYKAEYEKLMAPFKANGSQVQAKSIDDAMSLMQMGANYHKKMAGLKPSLKIVKMLEKNDLLDPAKISYLIDLHAKNPEAITKLMKDSGLDPLNIDTESDSKYVPKTLTVSDTELELESVLEAIQDTPTYAKTLNVLAEKWDVASRKAIADSPHIISIINEQMANGIYDQVANAVEHERIRGKLQGLSDLDAYKHMGDQLEAQGLFAHQKKTPPAVTTPAPVDDSARKDRKKAVSPTRSSGTPTPAVSTINPLAMSDEEFAKYDVSHLTKIR